MARGQTLVKMLDDLRSETRASLNPAHNNQVRDQQVKLLQRTQDWLWQDHTWPHLRVWRNYPLAIGQRYYDFNADFDIERITTIWIKDNGAWRRLMKGIGAQQMLVYDSDLGQRSYPPIRYDLAEDDQIEFHPISDKSGDASTLEACVRVYGIRRLRPLVKDSDRCDLDDRLIVLFAAAEILGGKGSKDGGIKTSIAQKHYATLRGQLNKRSGFRMFGVGDRPSSQRDFVGYYNKPVSTDIT